MVLFKQSLVLNNIPLFGLIEHDQCNVAKQRETTAQIRG